MHDDVFKIIKVLEWNHEEVSEIGGGIEKTDPKILRIHCENCSSEWKLSVKGNEKNASAPGSIDIFLSTKCPKCRATGDISNEQLNNFRI
jgi:ribosomal protein S27E